MTTSRTLICFSTAVGQLSGCNALEVGARNAWVHLTTGQRIKILRSQFTPEELIGTGHALAFKARRLADELTSART